MGLDQARDRPLHGGIVEGSFTSVKEQMPGTYAAKFAEQGFVALAFDYSHYGESAGEPRQLESPDDKPSDLQAAASYLTGLPYVQAVGMVGICTSAGNGAYLAAADPRVKALATVAGFLPGLTSTARCTAKTVSLSATQQPQTPDAPTRRPARWSSSPPTAKTIRRRSPTGGRRVRLLPQQGARQRPRIPQRGGPHGPRGVPRLRPRQPGISHHDADDGCPLGRVRLPGRGQQALLGAPRSAELVWADGTHFDYYDSPAQIDNAAANVTRFFRTHMDAASA